MFLGIENDVTVELFEAATALIVALAGDPKLPTLVFVMVQLHGRPFAAVEGTWSVNVNVYEPPGCTAVPVAIDTDEGDVHAGLPVLTRE
jgi:hypothetical protein